MIDSAVGLDPGVMTGMCFLRYAGKTLLSQTVLLQCDWRSAPLVLHGHLLACYGDGANVSRRVGSVEAFVTGNGAGSKGKAADVTRALVLELGDILRLFGYVVSIRPAADVKPWASDKRLLKAGIAEDPKKVNGEFRHAYDAARHALYGAKEAGLTDDPLLRRTDGKA